MPSFKTRRFALWTGGAEIGSSGCYMKFAGDGRQTMTKMARVYKDLWFPAQMWYGNEPNQFANAFNATLTSATCTPTVLPKNVYGGIDTTDGASPIVVPTLAASLAENKDGRAALCFIAPNDAASDVSSCVVLYYTTSDARTALDIQPWVVRWQYFGAGTSDVGGVSGSITYGASMASTGSGKLEIQTLGSTMSAFRSASPFVVLELELLGSNASSYAAAPQEQIYGMRIRYVAENLGTQVS